MTNIEKPEDGRVPEFAELQEAAAFWDEHSPLDFPDDFEEVDISDNRPSRTPA